MVTLREEIFAEEILAKRWISRNLLRELGANSRKFLLAKISSAQISYRKIFFLKVKKCSSVKYFVAAEFWNGFLTDDFRFSRFFFFCTVPHWVWVHLLSNERWFISSQGAHDVFSMFWRRLFDVLKTFNVRRLSMFFWCRVLSTLVYYVFSLEFF